MKNLTITLSMCLAILAGCAKKAEFVPAAAISTAKYDGWSCQKLAREKSFIDQALVRASATQDKAANNDAMMVILIGVPTSGGGVTGEVSRLKGEKEALRQSLVARNCRSS